MPKPSTKHKFGLRILLRIIIILLILIFAVYIVIWNSSVPGKLNFRDFRAEGLSLYQAAPSAIKYFKKYYFKNSAAPDSIKQFFSKQAQLNEKLKTDKIAAIDSVSISFVGDIMWIRNGWNSFLDQRVRKYLCKSDMIFGSLETPIDTIAKVPYFLPDYVNYNSNPGLIRSFYRDSGENLFTAVSIANNHALDQGVEGLERTLKLLDNEGVLVTGVKTGSSPIEKEYLLIEKNGVRIGFYAATWGLNNPELLKQTNTKVNLINGIAPLGRGKIDLTAQAQVLKKMREDSVDIKILFLHWGYEYELYPDQEIINVGRKFAEAGADLIIGSHPHVVQPNEICLGNGYNPFPENIKDFDSLSTYYYKFNDSLGVPRKSLIIYSLGNFTTAMYTPLCRLGLIQNVILYKSSSTGLWDWALGQSVFVFNNSARLIGSKRKLQFYSDFNDSLSLISPSKRSNIHSEVNAVLQLHQ